MSRRPFNRRVAPTDIIIRMIETMSIHSLDELTRLLQISSPAFPLGSFHYSQGLETAVDNQIVVDASTFEDWLMMQMRESMANLDMPTLFRLVSTYTDEDLDRFEYWVNFLVANRETLELRQEEQARGQAMLRILENLDINLDDRTRRLIGTSQLAGHAVLAGVWGLQVAPLAATLLYTFLENQVTAGIKTIPLGQSAGQNLIGSVGAHIPSWVEYASRLDDDDIGASTHGLAILCSLHETQYTRLFRS